MSRNLNYCFFRRLGAYLRLKVSVNITPIYHCNVYFSKGTKVLLASQICSTVIKNETPKIDIDDGLRIACEEGDVAIIKLMDELKEFVIIVSKEYRTCLFKQIEITKMASLAGPLSEVWDELPEYRVLADELNKELNDYITLFNTIGQMSFDHSLIEFVTGSKDNLDTVGTKYQELKIILQKEFEKNRKMEKELLKIKRDSILKDVTYG